MRKRPLSKKIASHKKVNLGCGKRPKEGYLNVDFVNLPGVDLVVDLNKYPYPFPDNYFEIVEMHQLLEHLDDIVRTMKELWRITKPNGKILIDVPHFTFYGAIGDPTHKHLFGSLSFHYFVKNYYYNYYFDFGFSKIKRKITFPKGLMFWNYLVEPIINFLDRISEKKKYSIYEATFLKALFPAMHVSVELIK